MSFFQFYRYFNALQTVLFLYFILINADLGLGPLLKLFLFWTCEKLGFFHSEGGEQILHFVSLMLSQEQEGICNCLCRSFCFPQQQFQHCKCSPVSLTVNIKIHQTCWEMNSVLTAKCFYLMRCCVVNIKELIDCCCEPMFLGGTGKGSVVLLKVREDVNVFLCSFITVFYVRVSPRELMLSKGEIPEYPSYWKHYVPFSYNTEKVPSASQREMKGYFNKRMTLSVKKPIFPLCST